MSLGRAAVGSLAVVVVAGATALGVTPQSLRHVPAASAEAFVRVNQVGYATGASKRALLMASGPETGATFEVRRGSTSVSSGSVGDRLGSWSAAFPDVYEIDLSGLHSPGDYTVTVSGPIPARSPTVHVASGALLYRPLLANALAYYRSTRDGADVDPRVLSRMPSHLTDRSATVYATPVMVHDLPSTALRPIGGPVDVEGGWFDAGDYLKFVETTSYVEGVMLVAGRDEGARFPGGPRALDAEAMVGQRWLSKMWDDASATLHLQVGLGGGSPGYVGDHDVWRLPEADDALSVTPSDPRFFIKYRPVFDAAPAGRPISPNLAGRLAADFGLCAQELAVRDPKTAGACLRSGEHVYALAETHDPSPLVTTVPRDFYPETAWRDDMEWGATELARALQSGAFEGAGLAHPDAAFYLGWAARWAHAYVTSRSADDSLNLYDTSALAHIDLVGALDAAGDPSGLAIDRAGLLADLRRQLAIAQRESAADPFGLGIPYAGPDATPHALGIAVTEAGYEALSGDARFRVLAQHQLDWLFGANAWGASFVIGAGAVFPHCPQSQIANLAGSLDGRPPVELGAVGDGPSALSNLHDLGLPAGARHCPPDGTDPFRAFSGKGARYRDDARSWPTVEPSLDYTVLTLLAFSEQSS
jgi:endoglucanase